MKQKRKALFLISRHRLMSMALTLCEHACKTVFDVQPGIETHAFHQLGHESKHIKFQVVL